MDTPQIIHPRDVTTVDELLQALMDTEDPVPLVPISVLVEALGDDVSKVANIKTHEFVDRQQVIQLAVLRRAVQMLPMEARANLIPQRTETNASNQTVPTD